MAKEPERTWARLRALYRFDVSVADGMLIAGCDEAGRGALAGPACVACVAIDITKEEIVNSLLGVDDSKRLTPKKRAELFEKIGRVATIGIGWTSPAEIDRIGIVPGLHNATRRAYAALGVDADIVLLDRGLSLLSDLEIEKLNKLKINQLRDLEIRLSSLHPSDHPIIHSLNQSISKSLNLPITRSFTRGDSQSLHIATASIVAKVTRDRLMEQLDRLIPGYGLAQHKGYGTVLHRTAITSRGRSPIHRASFTVK